MWSGKEIHFQSAGWSYLNAKSRNVTDSMITTNYLNRFRQ
eukprot:COSAG01_NODE_23971_length_795_cov_1.119253_1_plen_39_part_10